MEGVMKTILVLSCRSRRALSCDMCHVEIWCCVKAAKIAQYRKNVAFQFKRVLLGVDRGNKILHPQLRFFSFEGLKWYLVCLNWWNLRRYNMCIFCKQRGVVWFTKEFDSKFTRFTIVRALVTWMFMKSAWNIGLLFLKPKWIVSNTAIVCTFRVFKTF